MFLGIKDTIRRQNPPTQMKNKNRIFLHFLVKKYSLFFKPYTFLFYSLNKVWKTTTIFQTFLNSFFLEP